MAGNYLPQGFIIERKYELVRPIGSGGFSHVYQGLHTAMDRMVAIKLFDPDDQLDDAPDKAARRARRFEQEAQLVAQLEHPNTVTIYDFGVADDGKAYLVMEYIEGPTLKEVLAQRGPLSAKETIPIFLQILSSLEEAHHRKILHRDLKPANIMLGTNFKGEPIVKVLDFGIARTIRAEEADEEKSNLFLGTPRYAAPEQFKNDKLTLATDIYGVGALLWQTLVGQTMLASGDIRDCMAHALSPNRWELPADIDLPQPLVAVVERAVEKDPARRYQSAAQMINALEQCSAIDRSDLPEIEADDGLLRSARIVDPNIIDPDDRENFFLNPDGDEAVQNDPPPPLPVTDRPARQDSLPELPAPPPEEPLELDFTPSPKPQGFTYEPENSEQPQQDANSEANDWAPKNSAPHSSSATSPPTQRSTARTSEKSSRMVPVAAVALVFIVAAGIAAYFALGDFSDPTAAEQDNDTEAAAATDSQESQASAPTEEMEDAPDLEGDTEREDTSFMEASRFSVDGVTIALRADGWRLRQHTDTWQSSNYSYSSYGVERSDRKVDLTFYETRSESALQELQDKSEDQELDVVFDHILARISPREGQDVYRSEMLATQLRDFLQSYRQLVEDQGLAHDERP